MKIEDEIKGRFRNEYHKSLINLTYTVKQITYQILQNFKQHDISETQYNILIVLRGALPPGQVSINYLKERMLDENSDVSRIIDRLFEKGYIERKENTYDRRQKDISITIKGLNLLEKMYDCEKKGDTLLSNLDIDEIRELNRLLDKIRE